MNTKVSVKQAPAAGQHLLKFRGDTIRFSLTLSRPTPGTAWLRTNLGHAAISRQEIIQAVQHEEPPLGRDWYDIEMVAGDKGHYHLTLPLGEVGHFKAKCYFKAADRPDPIWPKGPNTVVNVEPAHTCCANIIYNIFVRQFGPNKHDGHPRVQDEIHIQALDQAGYSVIPPSGTFRDLIAELDFIIGELGCTILQLLPIHPTPTTFARMGRYGSPYAALSFTAVDPALAEFDPKATPLEQFIELVDAIHKRNGRIFMDIAINHTGWAASLHETHPQWLARDTEGRIEVPGAWGVRWEDLTRLDYRHKDLWQYMADVFLTWCRRGVDGFRCDAGYMIPEAAWEYIVASVREQYPDTIFLLEGLGGKLSVTRAILSRANFNWAYSELFQNYDRGQIEHYLPEAQRISVQDGLMVHFAETHDNNRLAARSHSWASMRTALCALAGQRGAFGFANGVEWYATEKINVHGAPSLSWGASANQVHLLQRLAVLLKTHPAFHDQVQLSFCQQAEGNYLALQRRHSPSQTSVLVLVNLDDTQPVLARWAAEHSDAPTAEYVDLITEQTLQVEISDGQKSCQLEPGQVLCLSRPGPMMEQMRKAQRPALAVPERIERQLLRAKALEVWCTYNGWRDLGAFELDEAARQLADNPEAFCGRLNSDGPETRVITWHWPNDQYREVMVPPGHFLLVSTPFRFRARLAAGLRTLQQEECLPQAGGNYFALFKPLPPPQDHALRTLKLVLYSPRGSQHVEAPLLYLAFAKELQIQHNFVRSDILHRPLLLLGTNGLGGMLRANLDWGRLDSRYDALLAANLHPEYPVDRWILFSRCRGWIVYQDYSQEICSDCLVEFTCSRDGEGRWRFRVPCGQGEHVLLELTLHMPPGRNRVELQFSRAKNDQRPTRLPDQQPVRLILRPDIEDRSYHTVTKAYLGPERSWPGCITPRADGFTFEPEQDRCLEMALTKGNFTVQPEWHYMVHRPLDAQRGMDPDSDLFSPGYFHVDLKGGQAASLKASCPEKASLAGSPPPGSSTPAGIAAIAPQPVGVAEAAESAMAHYLVRRGALSTVIAGYPWFLDWGRDTLIFLRGLITAGRTQDARRTILQLAQFEEQGTLPNMIRGTDASNRDTSDAPLWFFVSCADLLRQGGFTDLLETVCGQRTLRRVLVDMGQALISGTPNGVKMDESSGLLFSPSHFSWMDTNHPAGTPREGYPIEIQALWHSALSLLQRIDTENRHGPWKALLQRVQTSILKYHWLEEEGFLADCLHAPAGTPASLAQADDALRPNQLFALTLLAVTAEDKCCRILTACRQLLVPGAIRSLADRPLRRPLAIYHHNRLLNDPHHPYQGRYLGDEDTQRKPAYHNGTAWTWVFPSFCEAWALCYGPSAKTTALNWLGSASRLLSTGCVGHLPEILDGSFPHAQRGCDAQAWSVSELFRVWHLLAR